MRFRVLLFTTALACMVALSASAQEWEKTYPAWETDGIEDMLHWGGDTVFAGGHNTTLLRSTDAGASWERMDLSAIQLSTEHLYLNIRRMARSGSDLYFVAAPGSAPDRSSLDPWLHEDSVLFVYRVDIATGGVTDVSLPRKIPNMSAGIDYSITAAGGNIWVVATSSLNDSSVVYRSSNRGNDWEALAVRAELYSITCLTDSIMIAVEEYEYTPYLIRSTDAGATWSAHDDTVFVERSGLYSVAVSPKSVPTPRCVLSSKTAMIVSTDLGETWNETDELRVGTKYFDVVNLALDNSGALYAVGRTTDVYRSQTWNGSWVPVRDRHDEHNGQYRAASDLICTPSGIILSTREGLFYRTEDNTNWEAVNVGGIREVNKMHFYDERNGLMIAKSMDGLRHLFTTGDGGTTWTRQAEAGSIWYNVLWGVATEDSLRSTNLAFRGTETFIDFYRSTDNGATWETNTRSYIPSRIRKVYAEGGLYIAGSYTMDSLWCSPDFGATWIPSLLPAGMELSFDFSTIEIRKSASGAPVVYVVDDFSPDKRLYRSRDYCRNWELVTEFQMGDNTYIDNLIAVSEDTLFVVLRGMIDSTYQTVVQMSNDAGASWSEVLRSPVSFSVFYPMVQLPQVYRIKSGNNITLYKSDNTFGDFQIQMHKETSVQPVWFFLNADVGWIAAGQTIWHTTTGGIVWVEQPITVTETAAITDIYPNPVGAGQSAVVNLHLPPQSPLAEGGRKTSLRVSVYDLLGREVAVLYNGDANPGTRTLTWQPSSTLPAGVYIARMTLGDRVWARQVAVVR